MDISTGCNSKRCTILSKRIGDRPTEYLGYVNRYPFGSDLIKDITEKYYSSLVKEQPLKKFTVNHENIGPQHERWTITSTSPGWIYNGSDAIEYQSECCEIEFYNI